MRTSLVTPLVLVAGCFGDGPLPKAPDKAIIIYQLPISQDACSQSSYIGPVAFGPTYGFAGLLPYQPQENCNNGGNNGGGSGLMAPVPIYRFIRGGDGTAEMIGTAGYSDGYYTPRLQAIGAMDGVLWLTTNGMNNGGMPQLNIRSYPETLFSLDITLSQPMSGSYYGPDAIMRDSSGDNVFIAAAATVSNTKYEPNNPNYPCCGPPPSGSGGVFERIAIDTGARTTIPVPASFDCGRSTRCVAQNTQSLIYLASASDVTPTNVWRIAQFPKNGTMESEEAILSKPTLTTSSLYPVGFHATDLNVVWAMSRGYDSGGTLPTPACEIYRYKLGPGIGDGTDLGMILKTNAFDCAGLGVDDESVYFAIVETNDQEHMRGLGIGRIHLDSNVVETIDVGLRGYATGPRRVLIDDTDLIVVDPFTIARIPKSALDGQHDIAP